MLVRLIVVAFIWLIGFVCWKELYRDTTILRLANLASDKPVVGTARAIYESARKGPLHATITDVKFDCATAQAFRREKEEIRGGQPQGFLVTSPDRSVFVVVTRDHERPCGKAGATVLTAIALPVRSHVRNDFGPGLPKESMELMLNVGAGEFWSRLIGIVIMGALFLFALVRGLILLVSGK